MYDYMWDETHFYGIVDDLVTVYDDEQLESIKKSWCKKLNDNQLIECTFLRNIDFLRNFVHFVPLEEQFDYVQNTINYFMGLPYDSQYVLVARRAVPSNEAKPESFWSTAPNEPLYGLRNEIRDEERLHSVIMVTSLGKLKQHGLSTTMGRGCSDGEIVIDPNKAFDDFLFRYKPRGEFYNLLDYLEKGGTSRDELISKLQVKARERALAQGLQIDEGYYDEIVARGNGGRK